MLTTFLLVVTLLSGSWCSPAARLALKDLPHPKEWPCPLAADINPCTCTPDTESNLDMDCSAITSNSQLESIFQKDFPFTDFRTLTITPESPAPGFDTLSHTVFGPVSFQHVEIVGTNLGTVEEEALAYSHGSLQTLRLQANQLTLFPYETLSLYIYLHDIDLSHNLLNYLLPDVESSVLRIMDLSYNVGLAFADTTFGGCTELQEIYLQGIGLATHPVNVFRDLANIKIISLGFNQLSGVLPEKTINPPPSALVNNVVLRENALTNIHPLAITSLDPSATVDLQYNQFLELEEADWQELLSQVDNDDAIDLRNNPLLCGCDVYWLVLDQTKMRKIHSETICKGGELLHNLPPEFFPDHCSS